MSGDSKLGVLIQSVPQTARKCPTCEMNKKIRVNETGSRPEKGQKWATSCQGGWLETPKGAEGTLGLLLHHEGLGHCEEDERKARWVGQTKAGIAEKAGGYRTRQREGFLPECPHLSGSGLVSSLSSSAFLKVSGTQWMLSEFH